MTKQAAAFCQYFCFVPLRLCVWIEKNVSLTEVSLVLCICTLMPLFSGKDGDIRRPWKRNQCYISYTENPGKINPVV